MAAGCGTNPAPAGAGDASSDVAATDTSEEPAVCDHTLPACPPTKPSYQQAVRQIVTNYCAVCHYPGSTIANFDYSTYASTYTNRGPLLDQVDSCKMPPATSAPLPGDARTTLLTWLECGAPNN